MDRHLNEEFERRVVKIESEFDVPNASPDEVIRWLESGQPAIVLDVRSKEEFEVSALPGAVHVGKGATTNLDEVFSERLAQPEPARVFVYCAAGYMSSRTIDSLSSRLRDAVFNVRGGAIAYANAGGPLVRPTDGVGVREIHGYDSDWCRFIAAPNSAVLR